MTLICTFAGIDQSTDHAVDLNHLQTICFNTNAMTPYAVEWAFHYNPRPWNEDARFSNRQGLDHVLNWKNKQTKNIPPMALHLSGAAANDMLDPKKWGKSSLYDVAMQFDRLQFDVNTDHIGYAAFRHFILRHPDKTVTTLQLSSTHEGSLTEFMDQTPQDHQPTTAHSRILPDYDPAKAWLNAKTDDERIRSNVRQLGDEAYHAYDKQKSIRTPEDVLKKIQEKKYGVNGGTDKARQKFPNHEVLLHQQMNAEWTGCAAHYRRAYNAMGSVTLPDQLEASQLHAEKQPVRLHVEKEMRDDNNRFSLDLLQDWLANLSDHLPVWTVPVKTESPVIPLPIIILQQKRGLA